MGDVTSCVQAGAQAFAQAFAGVAAGLGQAVQGGLGEERAPLVAGRHVEFGVAQCRIVGTGRTVDNRDVVMTEQGVERMAEGTAVGTAPMPRSRSQMCSATRYSSSTTSTHLPFMGRPFEPAAILQF